MKISMNFEDCSTEQVSKLMAGISGLAVAATAAMQPQPPLTPPPAQQPAPGAQPMPGPVPQHPTPAGAIAGAVTHEMVKQAMQSFITQYKASAAKKVLDQLAAGQHEAKIGAFPLDKLPALLQAFQNPPSA